MERFKSKIGVITFLAFLIAGIFDVCLLMIWGLFGVWWPFLVFSCLFIVFCVPPFFFTYYKLTQDHLTITCLWLAFNKKIMYEDIVCVVPYTSKKISANLSSECIKIVYLKDGKTKEILVSPAMHDRFINFLTDNVFMAAVLKEDEEVKEKPVLFAEKDKKSKIKTEELKASKKVVIKNQTKVSNKTASNKPKNVIKTKKA